MTSEQIYHQISDRLNKWLSEHHKYNSPEREKILQLICSMKGPFSMTEIIEMAKEQGISRATIYNNIPILEQAEIIHCIPQQSGQHQKQYELLRRGTYTMKVICLRCGRVSEFRDLAIKNNILQRAYSNFIPQSTSLYVYGTCKRCTTQTATKKTK